ncbi:diguanylate cyclase domain-containing protein [Mordavella massiliensis]|uniref:Diguanylate cyclase n=1 Tax=Mordavella massiliensis TaxID=1871024 RepID=A0A938X9N6_9CLOT|nr:diguanylate cyclase [Mordavella massiliensis]
MEKELYQALDTFFQAYLKQRDIEKTLSLVTDDVYSLGTGEEEIALNKRELEQLLRQEMEGLPMPIRYRILDYHEKQCTPDCLHCFCRVETTIDQGEVPPLFYSTRFTGTFRREGGRWLASQLHMSEASRSQDREEFFPLHYISKQAEAMDGKAQKEILDIVCRIMPGGIIGGYIEEGFPLYVINDTMLEMMGYTYEEFVEAVDGMVANSFHEDDADRVTREVLERMKTNREYSIEYRVRKKDGGYLWVYDVGRKITTEDGREAIISVLMDVSKDVQNRIRLMEESSRDFLTEVYNRRGGESLLKERMKIPMPYAFLMLDLDDFKQVNDLYGHEEGDRMLYYTGAVLKQAFRQSDVVIRVGGDEFAVLAYPCSDADAIQRKAEQVIRRYEEEARRRYPESGTSISIGGICGRQRRSFQELYRLADQVLYEAKRVKGCCRIRRIDMEE